MKKAAWITFFYALILLIGGIMGHLKTASTASLITGIASSILLFLASIGMWKDKLFPCYFGILIILLLDAFFSYRWLFTFKFFPAGLMSLISLGVLIAVALLVRNHLREQNNQGK